MSEPEFNAAQRAHFQRAVEEQLVKYVKAIDLRKWAMQQALDLAAKVGSKDVIDTADKIYRFVIDEPRYE